MYNLKDEKPRPFEADYPQGARLNEQGKLTQDIEGRPLAARYIVGRDKKGPDNSFPEAEFNPITEALTGRRTQTLTRNQLGGAYGQVPYSELTKRPLELRLAKDLTDKQYPKVHAHELGHAIDQFAGEIPTRGLSKELRPLYSYLNTGQSRTRNLTEPKHLGYKGDDIPREYMSEALRAYMTNPNSLKTLAPKTAKRIREYVNAHPELKEIIQFNSIAAIAGLGALAEQNE